VWGCCNFDAISRKLVERRREARARQLLTAIMPAAEEVRSNAIPWTCMMQKLVLSF